jgi:hypothetical protein
MVGTQGRSLELFFIDGRPDGMLTAEVFNWTGHVLMTPRTQVSEALKRKEADFAGIYILFGEKDEKPLVYIGEAENVADRIRNHDIKKDWWTSAVLITSSDNKLNKAHVKYLEARLIRLAVTINKTNLDNATNPSLPSLTEASRANMEAFLENILIVLPALRINCFVEGARPDQPPDGKTATFELRVMSRDIHATAKLIDDEFVVQKGSIIAKSWNSPGYEDTGYAHLYEELVKSGITQVQAEHRVSVQNYAFTSASAAASVVNGHPTAGPLVWKVLGQQKTYKKWEEERLATDDIVGHMPPQSAEMPH